MGIQVGDNFDHKSKKPLDARTSYATLALMKAVTDANINEGCLAYCAETDKYYKFLSTNTVDETTGKWREFSSGGGGGTGGGHTIEDSEGTDLTQRDTLQFGEGFIAEDDDINEKTVISPDVMQNGDMDDVITPLPSVQTRYQKYSTEEQVVGEWIDGKPLYQCTFVGNSTTYSDSNNRRTFTCVSLTGVEYVHLIGANYALGENTTWFENGTFSGNLVMEEHVYAMYDTISYNGGVNLQTSAKSATNAAYKITLQYTKTTDTPNT